MKIIDALNKLKSSGLLAITTLEAASLLDVSRAYASQILRRLAEANQISHINRSWWALKATLDPLKIPELLCNPWPAYISLQTALFYHGMIEQIPQVIYAISLGKTKLYSTKLGDISVHQMQAEFFFDFETVGNDDIKIATKEKALIDIFYLSAAKSRLFASLPEVEIPKDFDFKKAEAIIKKIPYAKRRAMVQKKFTSFVNAHKSSRQA